MHDFTCDFIGVVSEEVIDEACLIAAKGGLTDLA